MTDATPSAHVAGVKLAHVNINATHTVEFWETQPGNIVLIQAWNAAQGEQKLDLQPQLIDAGNTFSALYRRLLNDPNAPLSSELVAADERRSHLPIRDASLPLPARPDSTAAPVTTGLAASQSASVPNTHINAPGALQTESVHAYQGGIDYSWCEFEINPTWCPGGAYYGFVNGNVQETIFWDGVGANPQSAATGGWDLMNVNQWINGAWQSIFSSYVTPGWSVEFYTSSTATYYQGSITGDIVAYGESWKLSFPQLTQIGTWPHWVANEFGNDINGITHDANNWILSRVENGNYGVIGIQARSANLQYTAPYRFYLPEPFAWTSASYNHYGDIVYDLLRNLLFVSLNKDPGVEPAIGVLNPADGYQVVGQAPITGVGNGNQFDCPWVAMDPRDDYFYTTEHSLSLLHRYIVSFPNGIVRYGGAAAHKLSDVAMVNPLGLRTVPGIFPQPPNTTLLNTGGGKVSSNGKLWILAAPYSSPEIYGVDPDSGIIQVEYRLGYSGGGWTSLEAEGLDITETDPQSPGVTGQIHAQLLGNKISDDQWSLVNLAVSDLSRL